MDIKKIVKRNLKNIGNGVFDIAFNIAFTPFSLGFAHASYLYFYITNPNGSDEELEQFKDAQGADFKCLLDSIGDKLLTSSRKENER